MPVCFRSWRVVAMRVSCAAAALLCAGALPGSAQDRVAFLLAPEGRDNTDLSRAFLEAGYDVSRLRWDGAGAPPALAAPGGARIVVHVDKVTTSGAADLLTRAEDLRRRGAQAVTLISEVCADWPVQDADAPEVSVIAPMTDDGGCTALEAPLAASMMETLASPGAVLDMGQMTGVMARGDLVAMSDARPAQAPAAPVVIGAMGAVSIGAAPAAVQVSPVAFSGGAATSSAGLTISPIVQPAALLSARATPEGLPRPSIIVGIIRDPSDDEAVDEAGTLSGSGLDTDTFDAREQMRQSDPEAYAGLVASGAFDPPPDALAASLQRVLQRMECYTLRIDGDWGNGSRAAVDRYYGERGSTAPGREATIDLFRDVILREDITCPAPVVVATPQRTTSTPRSTRTTTNTAPRRQTTTAAAPRRTQPAPQPQPTQSSGGIRNTAIIGGFR